MIHKCRERLKSNRKFQMVEKQCRICLYTYSESGFQCFISQRNVERLPRFFLGFLFCKKQSFIKASLACQQEFIQHSFSWDLQNTVTSYSPYVLPAVEFQVFYCCLISPVPQIDHLLILPQIQEVLGRSDACHDFLYPT